MQNQTARHGGIPRGILRSGPAILSYGFRPFFLGGAVFAAVAIPLWIGVLTQGWPIGGEAYGGLHWHAHEMVFGYAGAALAGFLLTAIPNWTGRLPLAGYPLLMLFGLWLGGRIVMLQPELFGLYPSALLDAAFLPTLALAAGREIVVGRNWKNLKMLAALGALSLVNFSYHAAVLLDGDPQLALRAGIAVLILLIALVGGRIVPSFTRNWLVKEGAEKLPHPFQSFDKAAIIALAVALSAWLVAPEGWTTAFFCIFGAVLQAMRLWRWRGYATIREPLLLILHVAYGFIPVGLVALAAASIGRLNETAAIHLLTVGCIASMTMAVMARATRGHTGRPLTASVTTTIAFGALVLAALARPMADILPAGYDHFLSVSAASWMIAYGLFLWEHAPMMTTARNNA